MPIETPQINVTINNSAIEAANSEFINTVAIVGNGVSGTQEKKVFTNYSDALSYYGASNTYNKITDHIKFLFANGCRRVVAYKTDSSAYDNSGNTIAVADYTAALAAIKGDDTIRIVVADWDDDTNTTGLHNALITHCYDETVEERPRFAIVGLDTAQTKSELLALNRGTAYYANNKSKYLMIVGGIPTVDGTAVSGSYFAAGLAGKISSYRRPVININGEEVIGFDGVNSTTLWSIDDTDDLIEDGITPIVLKNGAVRVVRGVMTYVQDANQIADSTYKDLGDVTIEQYIIWDLCQLLAKYLREVNTADTRNSIANETDMKLNGYSFLESFNPSICVDDEDEDGHGVILTVAYKPVGALHSINITLQRIIAL